MLRRKCPGLQPDGRTARANDRVRAGSLRPVPNYEPWNSIQEHAGEEAGCS
jgi:hypothetical protein